MQDALADLPGYALSRASSAMNAKFSESLAQLNLRRLEASVLIQVAANPGITPSALGNMIAIKRANMVPLVAGLEKAGYVSRDALDGRSFGLTLTEKGSDICAEVERVIKHHEEQLMDRVPAEHRAHLMPALRALWAG